MGTRSTIAVQLEDGSVIQSYCHWDGYIDHNGRILQEHYTNHDAAVALVQQGDMSSLGKRVFPQGEHSFNQPEDGTTVYYGRDRGETGCEPNVFADWAEFQKEMQHEEYDYVFKDGKWIVMQYERGWENLEAVIAEMAD
jgi:hypothetical protein